MISAKLPAQFLFVNRNIWIHASTLRMSSNHRETLDDSIICDTSISRKGGDPMEAREFEYFVIVFVTL